MKKLFAIILVLTLCLSFVFAATACKKDTTTYTVYAPDGAPALALAKMMKDGASAGSHPLAYSVIAATNVAASMTNGDADFIIAPTNAGVMQSVNTNAYYLLGVTSWGNLYLVTTDDNYKALEECASAAAFLSQFEGRSISSIGSNQVPDKSLKSLLNATSVTATVADAQTAAVIQNDLISGDVDTALLGEPAATATKALLAKNGISNCRLLASLSDVWKAVTGKDYPQAGVFVKKSVAAAADGKATVAAFEQALKGSIDYLNASAANAEELATYMESREDCTLKAAIVKQCYLRTAQNYVSAQDATDAIKALVGVLVPTLKDANYDGIFYQAQ